MHAQLTLVAAMEAVWREDGIDLMHVSHYHSTPVDCGNQVFIETSSLMINQLL